MQQLLLIVHVLVSVALIALVLLQHGKGADMGATFGSGASNTMFGSQGATPFLVKVIGILAVVFFATSLSLSYFVGGRSKEVIELQESQQPSSAPLHPMQIPAQELPGKLPTQ